jgi:hypothetical protein
MLHPISGLLLIEDSVYTGDRDLTVKVSEVAVRNVAIEGVRLRSTEAAPIREDSLPFLGVRRAEVMDRRKF